MRIVIIGRQKRSISQGEWVAVILLCFQKWTIDLSSQRSKYLDDDDEVEVPIKEKQQHQHIVRHVSLIAAGGEGGGKVEFVGAAFATIAFMAKLW